MQSNGIIFTSYELEIVQDSQFLPAKRMVMDKVEAMWQLLITRLGGRHEDILQRLSQSLNIGFLDSKISRGDNYMELPYVVLDFLRVFGKNEVFTYRCMFWWGNFFSFTLHIGGDSWDKLKPSFQLPETILNKETFIGCYQSPWEYHYGQDNYTLITADNRLACEQMVKSMNHLKLSRKVSITTPAEEILITGQKTFDQFIQLLR